MKKIYLLSVVLLFLAISNVQAYKYKGSDKRGATQKREANASGCVRAKSSTEISLNNVKALIHTGGDMWWDLVGKAKYEIPKGSGKTALFAGAIWIGGTDVNDQLRLAAIRYRSGGVDYWPGPLIISGMDRATVTPDVCSKYDRHFVISRQEVAEFRSYINAKLSGDVATLDKDFKDYQIPTIISIWPGNGDASKGYDFYLAPYVDVDANGYYNPESGGDYPYFEFSDNPVCGTSREKRVPRLYGDQTMWWVYNDKGNVHTETNGAAIGMEIRAQYFAFATSDELNNMTFGNYALINRSTYTLYNTYFGVWTDADMGDYSDDFVGCDVARGLGYLYNGKDKDGDGSAQTYGDQPPAIGLDFFEGPYMDPWVDSKGDTLDRPSPYKRDSEGRLTNVIDTSLSKTTNDDGLYNGGINGLNFGDSIPGNERWGMRRFLYFNSTGNVAMTDPTIASDYYNYLKGQWKDGRPLTYGGTGYTIGGGTPSHFMFPGNTDVTNWATEGEDPQYPYPGGWTEEKENNPPGDRRFVQSAGPFTLLPGAVNDITVGAVWARATTGGAFASVAKVQEADDKAQRLFDNCFRMIDGPDSPELAITELDKKLIFNIYNIKGRSNNYKDSLEDYVAEDPFIITDDPNADTKFRFEGYQVFQIKNASVTVSSLNDPGLSRLVFECDIKNNVSRLINYVKDQESGKLKPQVMVDGNNEGIKHSFELTQDAFAQSEKALVNFKKYYYIAVAYAYNEYKPFDPEDGTSLDGQKTPYLRGRKSATGGIKTFMGMPHKNAIQGGGVILNSSYGTGIPLDQIEGMGNGNNILKLQQKTIDKIMKGSPWKADAVSYEAGFSPVELKVIDPLNVKAEDFILRFINPEYYSKSHMFKRSGVLQNAQWILYPSSKDKSTLDTTVYVQLTASTARKVDTTFILPMLYPLKKVLNVYPSHIVSNNGSVITYTDNISVKDLQLFPDSTVKSERSIIVKNEQVIPQYGISVTIKQINVPGPGPDPKTNVEYDNYQNGYLTSSITYKDPSLTWLSAIKDKDGETPYNWIRSGSAVSGGDAFYHDYSVANVPVDRNGYWENIAGGLFAPYRVVALDKASPTEFLKYGIGVEKDVNFVTSQGPEFDKFKRIPSVKIVITSDKTKWSRCPVVEMCEYDTTISGTTVNFKAGPSEGKALKFQLRKGKSVDENGKPTTFSSFTVNGQTYNPTTGMGWFPGYAIDVETGERLNIFFGEDSKLGAFNGRDMMWNPSASEATDLYYATGGMEGELVFGGIHNIYVWGHSYEDQSKLGSSPDVSFAYDEGKTLYALLKNSENAADLNSASAVWNNVVWAGRPKLNFRFANYDASVDPYGFIQTDVSIDISMANPYRGGGMYNKSSFLKDKPANENAPMYKFSTRDLAATYKSDSTAEDALNLINVVPNPYYGGSEYELGRTENLVKFTNLPENCTISIYNIGGNLVRKFNKSSSLSYLDWDLKNEYGISISGGVYIIHIEVPGIGEKVLKWFGALRPIDLNNI